MDYELASIFMALAALIISFVSLVRTRKNSEVQTQLNWISERLAEKQYDKILESEEREGQPIFVIRTSSISGTSKEGEGTKVRIKIFISNNGSDALEHKHVVLEALSGGLWKLSPKAYIERVDIRGVDTILGERSVIINPGYDTEGCLIHIFYIDMEGFERIQEFEIFPEGRDHPIPTRVSFIYKKTYKVVHSNMSKWPLPF